METAKILLREARNLQEQAGRYRRLSRAVTDADAAPQINALADEFAQSAQELLTIAATISAGMERNRVLRDKLAALSCTTKALVKETQQQLGLLQSRRKVTTSTSR